MTITIDNTTAQAVVQILKQQLSPAEWEKLPRLIEQANETEEESEFYAASHQAAARFFEDEKGGCSSRRET